MVIVLAVLPATAQQIGPWEFPNFSDRVDLSVQNKADSSIDDVVKLNIAEVKKIAPGFPGTLAVASIATNPKRFLETEIDYPDSTDNSGEFSIAIKLAAHEKKIISIYYSSTLHDNLPQIDHAYASHNYGYNHATAAIESDLIGYRTYGGFFFDVQAHGKGQYGLFNSLLGYSSISHPTIEGEDVIHLGNTLGLGGLFLRSGSDVYRPPFNTPDYTHKTANPDEPKYRIISAGPLRAVVEAVLSDWKIGEDHVALRAVYEIDAGSEVMHCRWRITPLHLSRSYEIGAGIRNLPDHHILQSPNIVVTSGIQDAKVGRVALGISFPLTEAHLAGTLQTSDGGNQILVFAQKLHAGNAVHGEYSFAAAWSGSGWLNPAEHVRDVLQNDVPPSIVLIQHLNNPNPKDLEGEPK
jgi:hypothetical protein